MGKRSSFFGLFFSDKEKKRFYKMVTRTSLNCGAGMVRKEAKQWWLTDWSITKKLVRCSGNSSKS